MSNHILCSTTSFITTMKFNRPEAKNAINQSMYQFMTKKLHEWAADNNTRVLVITGSDNIFTSGNDIRDFMSMAAGADDVHGEEFMKALIRFPKPIIAAINGPAIGIGTTLLQYMDFTYVSETAYMMTPFVALGLCPEFGSSSQLETIVGRRKARSMLLSNEPMSAEEAVQYGMANEVCDDPFAKALKKAEQLAAMAPESMILTKSMLNHNKEEIVKLIEKENKLLLERVKKEEAKEAINAFIEKRMPSFL